MVDRIFVDRMVVSHMVSRLVVSRLVVNRNVVNSSIVDHRYVIFVGETAWLVHETKDKKLGGHNALYKLK